MGLSCSWLFNNSKGQDTGEKIPNQFPHFPLVSSGRRRPSPGNEYPLRNVSCLKEKQKGRWEETLRPAFFPRGRVQTASRRQAGAGRGRQGLAAPCAGAQQRGCRQRGRSEENAIPCASLSPALRPRCGCPRQPQVVARLRLLLVPCSPSLPPSRHRTRHSSKHSPRSWRGSADTGEPEGARPAHPTARGSVPSCSTLARPGFI